MHYLCIAFSVSLSLEAPHKHSATATSRFAGRPTRLFAEEEADEATKKR